MVRCGRPRRNNEAPAQGGGPEGLTPAGAGALGEAGHTAPAKALNWPLMGPSTAPHPATGGRRVPPCLTIPKEVIAAVDLGCAIREFGRNLAR